MKYWDVWPKFSKPKKISNEVQNPTLQLPGTVRYSGGMVNDETKTLDAGPPPQEQTSPEQTRGIESLNVLENVENQMDSARNTFMDDINKINAITGESRKSLDELSFTELQDSRMDAVVKQIRINPQNKLAREEYTKYVMDHDRAGSEHQKKETEKKQSGLNSILDALEQQLGDRTEAATKLLSALHEQAGLSPEEIENATTDDPIQDLMDLLEKKEKSDDVSSSQTKDISSSEEPDSELSKSDLDKKGYTEKQRSKMQSFLHFALERTTEEIDASDPADFISAILMGGETRSAFRASGYGAEALQGKEVLNLEKFEQRILNLSSSAEGTDRKEKWSELLITLFTRVPAIKEKTSFSLAGDISPSNITDEKLQELFKQFSELLVVHPQEEMKAAIQTATFENRNIKTISKQEMSGLALSQDFVVLVDKIGNTRATYFEDHFDTRSK